MSKALHLDPIAATLGGFELLTGVGKIFMGDAAQEQHVYNEAYRTTYENSINQFRTEQQNKAKAEQYGAKLDYVRQQVENNFLAAQASWTSEQMRLNEVYDQAAYRSQSMQKMLAQAMGTSAAREVYGKSARRGALVSTLGAYGRTRAQQVDQLISEQTAAQMRMQDTERKMKAQNKLAIAQTSVLPVAATFAPTPLPGLAQGSFAQTAMQVADVTMGAAKTFFTGAQFK